MLSLLRLLFSSQEVQTLWLTARRCRRQLFRSRLTPAMPPSFAVPAGVQRFLTAAIVIGNILIVRAQAPPRIEECLPDMAST